MPLVQLADNIFFLKMKQLTAAISLMAILWHSVACLDVSKPNLSKVDITGGLNPGDIVRLVGTISSNPTGRFDVNFWAKDMSNLAMHMNLRFDEGAVVFNTATGDSWIPGEQRLSLDPFVETYGREITLEFRAMWRTLEIFLNDRFFFVFWSEQHPLSAINLASVDGESFTVKSFELIRKA